MLKSAAFIQLKIANFEIWFIENSEKQIKCD